jgi:menaquinone-dependent protoporphyrinogen oxidase
MLVLVAYASKHGSTQGIAERIAAILRASGLEVDLAAAEDAGDPAGYDAFVIGSAVYACRWMAPASDFIRHNGALLTDRPVWLFSVGPAGRRIPLPATLPPVLAALGDSIGARDHHVFRGAIDASKLRGVERLIRLFLPEGDFRDWPDIEAWASGIASELRLTRPPHAPCSAGRDRSRPRLEGL